MMAERVIIPKELRSRVLETLHSAHQGVYKMMLRAQDTVFWPGISGYIKKTRANCATCQAIAPSQPNFPPVDPILPEYPFHHIVMDHFALNNKSYGVFADRFMNWPGEYMGDSSMDACKVVARLSEDYGIPEMLTTNGGKDYTSKGSRHS